MIHSLSLRMPPLFRFQLIMTYPLNGFRLVHNYFNKLLIKIKVKMRI